MGFFGRKKNDVLDLTRYAKKNPVSQSNTGNGNPDVIDLGFMNKQESKPADNSGVNLGFMDAPANTGSGSSYGNSSGASYGGSIADNLREARRQRLKTAFKDMKVKIDDSDYRIANLTKRINELEERLRELERQR